MRLGRFSRAEYLYILGMPEPGTGLMKRTKPITLPFSSRTHGHGQTCKWLSRAAILLGLTASMFPEQDVEKMMILADALK